MLIDGFTVLAQVINFLVLIWLLNRFLFKPIRSAIEQREKKMAEALRNAEQAEKAASARALALEKERSELAKAREDLMADVRQEVDRWREAAMERAKEEVASLRKTWMTGMARDRQVFFDRLKRRMVQQVVRIGEKTIRDLSDQGLNRQVLRVFLEKVAHRKDELNTQSAKHRLVVQSGIPLDEQDAGHLETRLSKWFPEAAPIRFESRPDLGLGIQLVVGDCTAAWHLADYLRDLETEIMDNLFQPARMNS